MRASVAFQYPVTYVPHGSRKPREAFFQDAIDIDIPEIDRFDETSALRVRFPLVASWENRLRANNADYDPILELAGHAGKLWRDCWGLAEKRFCEIFTPELGGAVGRHAVEAQYARLMEHWSHPNGREPELGFLHWLDRAASRPFFDADRCHYRHEEYGCMQPCVVRTNGKARIPQTPLDFDATPREVISNGREQAAKEIRRRIETTFMAVNGRLFEAVSPPVLTCKHSYGVITKISRELFPGSPNVYGSAFFRLDEKEQFDAFNEKLAGRSTVRNYCDIESVHIDHLDPNYIAFDRTDVVIQSMAQGLTNAGIMSFHMLPDETMDVWRHLRRTLGAWSAEEGDPRASFDAYEDLLKLVSDPNYRMTLRSAFGASFAQKSMLDLSQRVRPSADPSLDDLKV